MNEWGSSRLGRPRPLDERERMGGVQQLRTLPCARPQDPDFVLLPKRMRKEQGVTLITRDMRMRYPLCELSEPTRPTSPST